MPTYIFRIVDMAKPTEKFNGMSDDGSDERVTATDKNKNDNLIKINFGDRGNQCIDLLSDNSMQILGVEETLGNRALMKISPLISNELD